MTHLR